MADGRIIIDTEIDNSGAEGGIKTLNAKLGSLAKTGLATFTGAIVAAGSAIGGLAGIATKYNSQMEDYFANFTVLLGSTTEATKHVEALKKFAAKTPFEMAGLANASKQLLSFGIGIDDIMPDLQMLGDISLGNQERFKGLALVFAQVASAGKLTGQDLLQFINQGFNPLQVIAEQTGKSMSDLKEEMSDGKITYEMVAEAMRVATSEGGKFYQGMEVQSQTLSGMWSTLKDDTMSLIGEAFTPFSEILKTNVMPALQGVVEQMSAAFADPNIQTSISNIASGLGDFITKVAELVSEWLPKVIEGFAWLLDHSNEITAGIIGLGTALMVLNVANMIMGLVKAFQAFKLANEGATIAQWLLNAAMSANPIGIVVALIAGLVAAVIYLWNTNEGFRNAVIKIFSAIMSTISWVVNGIVNFFTSTIPNAIKSALNWFSNLGSNMHSIGSNIVSGIWNGITGAAGWLMNKIKGFASSVISGIKGFFGIHSPSRIMRDLIGTNIVKGIGVGIDVETPNLEKDIDANMSDLIAKMQGTVDYETSMTTAKVVAHNNTLGGGTDEGKDKTQKQVVENHIHVDIEGREVAYAIAPHQDILNEYQEGR
ncbi:MAG: tape measure protein [Bacilli bacterium]